MQTRALFVPHAPIAYSCKAPLTCAKSRALAIKSERNDACWSRTRQERRERRVLRRNHNASWFQDGSLSQNRARATTRDAYLLPRGLLRSPALLAARSAVRAHKQHQEHREAGGQPSRRRRHCRFCSISISLAPGTRSSRESRRAPFRRGEERKRESERMEKWSQRRSSDGVVSL